MCYDIKVSLERQLKVARQYGDLNVIAELEKKLLPLLNPIEKEYNQISGFAHPEIFILSEENVELAEWGLIPSWVKDEKSAKEIANKTLNARGETIFEKPSFKASALSKRCIVFVDGFYENHHFNKKTYPYFIQRRDNKMMPLAGLYETWENPLTSGKKTTFSIVTCKANTMMAEIHNNPKLNEPRMPLIIGDESIENWINEEVEISDHSSISRLIRPADEKKLISHTVRRFRRDNLNSENSSEEFHYPELGPTLFD